MEKNEIAKIEGVTKVQLIGYLDAMGLAQKLTEQEKTQFLEISQAFGLNPFKREIFCSKYGEGSSAQMSIIVGYETYIKRAERSGQLDGWHVVTDGKAEDNTLKATITIYRKDRKYPFIHEVFYSEYVQKTRDGQVTKFWQKAQTMIKKVAISQGFRLCFSDELGGMPYTSEEIPQQENTTEDITHVVVKSIEEQVAESLQAMSRATSKKHAKEIFLTLSQEMQDNPHVKDGLVDVMNTFNKTTTTA